MTSLRGKKIELKKKCHTGVVCILLHSKQDRKNEIALFLRPCLNAYDKLGVKQRTLCHANSFFTLVSKTKKRTQVRAASCLKRQFEKQLLKPQWGKYYVFGSECFFQGLWRAAGPVPSSAWCSCRHRAGSVCSQGSMALTLGHKVLVLDLQHPRGRAQPRGLS